ncbi:myomegalin-like isoform X2 [Osmerus mordax]|uniref:myomegalin-like isoform X2 n=1 Tax=Osmerus mordax TaxID=8014 RepID=UPI00350FC3B2
MDAASEYGQVETRSSRASAGSLSLRASVSHHPSIPPSTASSHGPHSICPPSMHCPPHNPADMQGQPGLLSGPAPSLLPVPPQSPYRPRPPTSRAALPFDPHAATLRPRYHGSGLGAFSMAEVHQELQMLQRQLGHTERYSMPQTKTFQGFPPTLHNAQADHTSFLPLSYPPYHPSHLSGTHASLNAGLNSSPAVKPGPSLLESSALWETNYGAPPRERVGADVSSGSSGYQSGTSHTGSELMKEHLREIRNLRQRLEDSIQTNDRLRQQLEERLATAAREKGAPTNIYIQGLDSVSQLSNEIRALKDDNLSLQGQLKQASREGSKEAEHLREAVLMGRARLKEAELEAERWAEQVRRLQSHAQTQSQEITQLKLERLSNQETISRLQEEVTLQKQQLCEGRGLAQSLQRQLNANHRGRATPPGPPGKTSRSAESVTFDPRDLQVQLEEQMSGRPGQGGHARRMLFLETLASPPVRDIGLLSPPSPLSPPLRPEEATDNEAGLAGQAPDGSFSSRSGRHMVGHVDDFSALKQQLLEGCVLIRQLETTLRSSSTSQALLEFSLDKSVDTGSLRNLQASTKTLRQILEEASSLLRMFWRAALPSREGAGPSAKKALREEMSSLRATVSEQEQALRDAMDRLKSSNRTKDSMEHFIVNQLSRTRDVLKKAKTNLQENELKLASLGLPSSSLPPPSSFSSFSARPWAGKGENPGPPRELRGPPGWGVLTPLLQASPPRALGSLRTTEAQAQHRPLQA